MTKRKSWDEKSKGMHKSRKLIIDTVFGREDNTQRVHGYEGERHVKREKLEKFGQIVMVKNGNKKMVSKLPLRIWMMLDNF